MKHYDIAFIGHMCYDEVQHYQGETVVAPGSAVLCGAMVTARIGMKTAAVVKMSVADEHITQPMKDLGVDVYLIPAAATTYSRVEHKTANVDERSFTIVKTAGIIDIKDVPKMEPRWVHLAGISDSEFDLPLIDGLKARGYKLSTDMQSFIRRSAQTTSEKDFSDVPEKKEIAAKMDMLKLDVIEARVLTGTEDLKKAAAIIESWGCPEIMITRSDGVLVRAGGVNYFEKFSNSSTVGRTGRGDTTFAAYLSRRLEYDPAKSLKFAAALVSIKMETYGPFQGTLDDVLNRMKEKR